MCLSICLSVLGMLQCIQAITSTPALLVNSKLWCQLGKIRLIILMCLSVCQEHMNVHIHTPVPSILVNSKLWCQLGYIVKTQLDLSICLSVGNAQLYTNHCPACKQ
jgi:hypothetical protein